MYDVIVIGGGASGMMAAITAAKKGCSVKLLEKMASCGRKMRITGKGRCNVTTMKSHEEILASIRHNSKFMYSAFSSFDNKNVYSFFESNGCPLKVERGDRVFPKSDCSQDVVNVLVSQMKALGVQIEYNIKIEKITKNEENIFTVGASNSKTWSSRAVIVCTGGASYPATGSSGDGYEMLEKLGIDVKDRYPALVPIVSDEQWVKELQGLSLKNVELKITNKKKCLFKEQGEMLFTHFGISGPLVLSASGHCSEYWQKHHEKLMAHIDMKPALTEQQLDARLLREIETMHNKHLPNLLKKLLPQKMVPIFIELCGVNQDKVLHQLTKEERKKIIEKLKDLPFTLIKTRSITEGIVTAGGISVKEINPKSMEIKKIPGLFVAGEIIDVDAYTGGFNLQIAFSTGHSAGEAASQYCLLKEEN